jgi:hypothetical protein
MTNKGISPIDPDSPVGSLRALVGDTSASPLNPVEEGYASYAVWSDLMLEAALFRAGSNLRRAAGDLYAQLAAEYAQLGRSVKTNDLALNTTSRGSDLLDVAKAFYEEAERADKAAAADIFTVVPLPRARPLVRPEATPWPML